MRAIGIEFCNDDLDAYLPGTRASDANGPAATPSEPVAPTDEVHKGGRNADKHGEPIAKMTLRLLEMSDVEFNRETGETVGPDLAKAYRTAGAAPPSDQNLIGIARGIMRIVRAARAERVDSAGV